MIISILCKPIQYWNMSNMWSDAYLKSKKFTIPVVHPNNVRWGALTSLHSSFTNCAVPAMLEFKTSCQLRAHASTSFWFWFECLLVIYTSLFCGWYHKNSKHVNAGKPNLQIKFVSFTFVGNLQGLWYFNSLVPWPVHPNRDLVLMFIPKLGVC